MHQAERQAHRARFLRLLKSKTRDAERWSVELEASLWDVHARPTLGPLDARSPHHMYQDAVNDWLRLLEGYGPLLLAGGAKHAHPRRLVRLSPHAICRRVRALRRQFPDVQCAAETSDRPDAFGCALFEAEHLRVNPDALLADADRPPETRDEFATFQASKITEEHTNAAIGVVKRDRTVFCPRCLPKQTQVEYHELQTRSADEPAVLRCVCLSCHHRWNMYDDGKPAS